MHNEFLCCPFCGEQPEVDNNGTCIDISCCCSMSIQKCDYLTLAERETFNYSSYRYSQDAENKAMNMAIQRWNTRT